MKLRVLTAVLAAGVLGACTNADWDHALSYAGVGDTDKPAAAAPADTASAPAAAPMAAPPADGWCEQLAKAAQSEAAEQGFDAATQQHRAQTAHAQCMASPASAAAN